MSSDHFSANQTSFCFEWPTYVTGVERVFMSARGDLQRLLSSYFNKPISVVLVYESKPSGPSSNSEAAADTPITIYRKIRLMCEGHGLVDAESTIRMSNPTTAKMFIDDRIAIGQMYRTLGVNPAFTLLQVGMDEVSSKDSILGKPTQHMWRKYILTAGGFECEIKETFLHREIFGNGGEAYVQQPIRGTVHTPITGSTSEVLVASNSIHEQSSSSLYGAPLLTSLLFDSFTPTHAAFFIIFLFCGVIFGL